MVSVAFFRNLNLGQPGSPTRAQLLEAFAVAGADTADSFQSNGTVAFTATAPTRVARAAARSLGASCGWHDLVVVRSAGWLVDLAARLESAPPTTEVTLYDARADFPETPPWRPPEGRMTVIAADRRHMLSVSDEPRTSYGTPTAERLLGVRATSRGAGTVLRLVARLGRDAG